MLSIHKSIWRISLDMLPINEKVKGFKCADCWTDIYHNIDIVSFFQGSIVTINHHCMVPMQADNNCSLDMRSFSRAQV
jgi:hypothetical protein